MIFLCLTLSRRRPLSYRNQSTDLRSKSMDWFLYDNGLRLESVQQKIFIVSNWLSHVQQMIFTFSEWFYIQQKIYIFSNLKFVFSNIRFTLNNLRFAFNEMKFIKLKPFTFSKPNLDVTKHTTKSIWQNKGSGL